MSGFAAVYVAGGKIKVTELPHPQFPRKERPYTKGLQIKVPASFGNYYAEYTLPQNMELISVALACSAYALDDFWETIITKPDQPAETIHETIYTKELPESINLGNNWGVVYDLPAGTLIQIRFNNASGTQKRVWPNLKFLR